MHKCLILCFGRTPPEDITEEEKIWKAQDVTLQIINKSITFGANHLIIAHHKYLPKVVFEFVKLVIQEIGANLKMTYGKEISGNLDLLYMIGTYARG